MHTIINPPPPSTPEGTPVVYIKEQVSQLRGALDPLLPPPKKRSFAECAEWDGSNTQLALRTGDKWEIYVRVYQNEFEIKDKTNTNNPLHV